MLAFYSIYSSLAIPPFPTTMLIICSVFVFPPLFLSFLRLSAFTVGVTKVRHPATALPLLTSALSRSLASAWPSASCSSR